MSSRLFKTGTYGGGPDFDHPFTVGFELEGVVLELTLPASDSKWENPPRPLNLPYKTPGWFEQNSERPNLRAWVHIYTKIWYYFPVRLKRLLNLATMGANNEMGNLSLGIHLNKLQGGKLLDLANPNALTEYIKWEYDDYYESPEKGPYGKGSNYETRKEHGATLAEKGEWYREQHEAALKSELMPMPEQFGLRDFGGGHWTYFSLGKCDHIPAQNFCLPLSELYYLHIDIEPTFHMHYRESLEPDMLNAAEWLRQHIKITFPGKPAGSMALPG